MSRKTRMLVALAAIAACATASTSPASAGKVQGCKLIQNIATGTSLPPKQTVFRIHLDTSVCYNGYGKGFTSTSETCHVSDQAWGISASQCVTSHQSYGWADDPFGGYMSQATVTIQNCLWVACWKTVSVTLITYVGDDGSVTRRIDT